jgi:DNA-binding response OmpR family regulator
MKLLVIEDDKSMAYSLRDILEKEYCVDLAFTGKDGVYNATVNDYDLVIIDYLLPDANGIEVMRQIRELESGILIIFLTGCDAADRMVEALDNGADDYMSKPFDSRELSARIRALFRRHPQCLSSNVVYIGDLRVDFNSKIVYRGNKKVSLRRKEFDLLEYFVRNSGKVLTRNMIIEHIWDSSYESFTNAVDVHVSYLRDHLDRPFDKKLIKTVYGVGYKLEV